MIAMATHEPGSQCRHQHSHFWCWKENKVMLPRGSTMLCYKGNVSLSSWHIIGLRLFCLHILQWHMNGPTSIGAYIHIRFKIVVWDIIIFKILGSESFTRWLVGASSGRRVLGGGRGARAQESKRVQEQCFSILTSSECKRFKWIGL